MDNSCNPPVSLLNIYMVLVQHFISRKQSFVNSISKSINLYELLYKNASWPKKLIPRILRRENIHFVITIWKNFQDMDLYSFYKKEIIS